jgi:hypothetical protein
VTAVADPRVRITSPAPNQTFAPGDTVHVVVQVDASASAAGVMVWSEIGIAGKQTPPFELDMAIPDTFAGPGQLVPGAIGGSGASLEGAAVPFVVIPRAAPQKIVVDDYIALVLPEAADARKRIIPIGVYAGGVERDLRSPALGTTYTSSDPSVVTVAADGVLTAVAAGTATITTQHRGVKAFTTVDVSAAGEPPPPKDVTTSLALHFGGLRPERRTGFFVQEVQVTAPGTGPLPGPLVSIVSNLPAGVFLVNNNGVTEQIPPTDTPFLTVPLGDGLALQPAERGSLKLQFLNPDRVTVSYDMQVFQAQDP